MVYGIAYIISNIQNRGVKVKRPKSFFTYINLELSHPSKYETRYDQHIYFWYYRSSILDPFILKIKTAIASQTQAS